VKVEVPPARTSKRSFGRNVLELYYDVTSMFRGAKIRHGNRLLPGKYSLIRILDAWAFFMFSKNWPTGEGWNLFSVQALALILGILVFDAIAARIPFVEIMDAISGLASAVASRSGQWMQGLPLLNRTRTESEETIKKSSSVQEPMLPTEGGVTE
jgi:hypothetical protein